ncbi:MAG: LCP family protein [Clostridiales bacterium]|jgi:LCP family protein required for cell wall assembly|nr:LCP family protein [Clostridiales bacterium]
MNDIFCDILLKSVSASMACAVVLFARALLRKAPKIYSYAMWSVVLFHLICPFSIESAAALLPKPESVIEQDVLNTLTGSDGPAYYYADDKTPSKTVAASDGDDSAAAPQSANAYYAAQIFNIENFTPASISWLWAACVAFLCAFAVVRYIRIKSMLFDAVRVYDNIYSSDKVIMPFVLGIIKPRIYVPLNMKANEMDYVIAHERTHISRRDYLTSLIAFFALAVHCFNPLIWICYHLMIRDMEMSCDEAVLNKNLDAYGYSQTLLNCTERTGASSGWSAGRVSWTAYPIMFGSVNIKNRVKNVLRYKKPAWWIAALCVGLTFAVAVGCAANKPISAEVISIIDDMPSDEAIAAITPTPMPTQIPKPTSTPLPNMTPSPTPKPDTKTNFLVVGEDKSGARTDVILAVCFDSATAQFDVVSIPRDTYVVMPKETIAEMEELDLTPPHSGKMKINEINAYGGKEHGMKYLRQYMEEFLGINLDYEIELNLKAFDSVVDELGGVYFDVPKRGLYYNDPYQNLYINIPGGYQLLNGKQAEGLVRYRASYNNGDLDRINVQQEFMKALIEQVLDKENIFANAVDVLKGIMGKVRTDFGITDIPKYVGYIGDIKAENVRFHTLPGEAEYFSGGWYFVHDETEMEEFIKEIFAE